MDTKIGQNVRAMRGLTLLDWFATFAPEPAEYEVNYEMEQDKLKNPHNDSYKPKRRLELEIKCELRYKYAKAMMKARTT